MGLARMERAKPDGSSATLGDGLAEACQRSLSSHDDGAADGTAGLASRKVQASVQAKYVYLRLSRVLKPASTKW